MLIGRISVGGYVVIFNRLGIFAIVLATTFFGIVTTSASKLELLPFFQNPRWPPKSKMAAKKYSFVLFVPKL